MTMLVFLVLSLAAFSVVSSERSGCPAVACTLELRPGQVQTPAVMVYKNKVCDLCDKWMNPAPQIDLTTGCPRVPCILQALKPGCARKTFFVWNGNLCPGCEQEWC